MLPYAGSYLRNQLERLVDYVGDLKERQRLQMEIVRLANLLLDRKYSSLSEARGLVRRAEEVAREARTFNSRTSGPKVSLVLVEGSPSLREILIDHEETQLVGQW